MNIWEELPEPFFVLAPMDDVTDTVFRRIIANLPYPSNLDGVQGAVEQRTESYMEYDEGAVQTATKQSAESTSRVAGSAGQQAGTVRGYGAPDLFFTEFVNVEALNSPGREKTLPRLRLVSKKEHPIVAQIWGLNPENFRKAAAEIAEMGYDGIDLNFGCPIRNVVANGACSALILPENRGRAVEMIQATQEGSGSLPVSVKTRLGYSTFDPSWHELLLKQKLNALTIHGRTKSQMSKVPADWDKIGEIRKLRDELSPTTKIIGNGDVMTRAQGSELATRYSLDGIMIGRGIFHDPYVFAEISPWESMDRKEKTALYRRHIELFAQTWQNDERKLVTLNKFCKIYIQGFDGAKELREKLMSAQSVQELLTVLE